MRKDDPSKVGLRSETGELYMLNKKERILTVEILSEALRSMAGKEFIFERFGKEGLKIAISLLEEMGVEIRKPQAQRPRTMS